MNCISGFLRAGVWEYHKEIAAFTLATPLLVEGGKFAKQCYDQPTLFTDKTKQAKEWIGRAFSPREGETKQLALTRIARNALAATAVLGATTGVVAGTFFLMSPAMAIPAALSEIVMIGKGVCGGVSIYKESKMRGDRDAEEKKCQIAEFALKTTILNGQQIVLLYGSGSAGKSTFSREIYNSNSNWCHIDEDEVFNEVWLAHISKLFPNEYKCITEVLPHENLFQAIKNSTIIFPQDSTLSQIETVKNAIEIIQCKLTENNPEEFRKINFQNFEKLILDHVREKINNNKSIILDRWYTTPEMLSRDFPDALVKKVLVFSTLEHTLDNFKKRNEKAIQTKNSSSHRLYKNLLPSFTRLYRLSNDPKHSLHSYQRPEIENIFKDIRDALPIEKTESKKSILFDDITKEGLDKLKEGFVLKESHGDTLFLSPIDQYDFIIKTQRVDRQKSVLKQVGSLLKCRMPMDHCFEKRSLGSFCTKSVKAVWDKIAKLTAS